MSDSFPAVQYGLHVEIGLTARGSADSEADQLQPLGERQKTILIPRPNEPGLRFSLPWANQFPHLLDLVTRVMLYIQNHAGLSLA